MTTIRCGPGIYLMDGQLPSMTEIYCTHPTPRDETHKAESGGPAGMAGESCGGPGDVWALGLCVASVAVGRTQPGPLAYRWLLKSSVSTHAQHTAGSIGVSPPTFFPFLTPPFRPFPVKCLPKAPLDSFRICSEYGKKSAGCFFKGKLNPPHL